MLSSNYIPLPAKIGGQGLFCVLIWRFAKVKDCHHSVIRGKKRAEARTLFSLRVSMTKGLVPAFQKFSWKLLQLSCTMSGLSSFL